MSKPTSIRLTEEIDTQLALRGVGGGVNTINEALDRYYCLLTRARQLLRKSARFTPTELGLLADSTNGTLFEGWSIPLLYANVEDSVALDHLDAKCGVDGQVLIDKLKTLDLASTFALVDASERFWRKTAGGQAVAIESLLDF